MNTNRCPLCGSDDLQKADDMMDRFDPLMRENLREAAMAHAREASRLRSPHMNGACASARA
jgi:hypothetical protein